MLTDAKANDALNSILGVGATIFPATVYIGLMTQVPNDDGTGVVEPVGSGYARVAVPNDATNWGPAAARTKAHLLDIAFPAASGGSWGTVSHVGFFDAASGGNLLAFGNLDTSRTVNDTDIFSFLAASSPLSLTL